MAVIYNNILVAVDGSQEAEWAFKTAIDVAKRNDAKLILAHVVDNRTFAAVEAYSISISESAEQYAKDLLEEYKQIALDAGVRDVAMAIEFGSPKVKIPKDIAKSFDVDLIICGATGLNAVERFFIGSVSEHIIRYAKCDVMVIRSDDKITEPADK